MSAEMIDICVYLGSLATCAALLGLGGVVVHWWRRR